MFDHWTIWGSVIALGIIVIFTYSSQKPQFSFIKKIKYVHVRSIKKAKVYVALTASLPSWRYFLYAM